MGSMSASFLSFLTLFILLRCSVGPVPGGTVVEEAHGAMESSKVHYREENGDIIFKTYIPPSRDSIELAPYVLYLIMAAFIIMFVLYAIIGHLIRDLCRDFADWLFGKEPDEVNVNFFEHKDKFMVDWCPETSPELEEMARAEQVKIILENNKNSPAIWVISDGQELRPARVGPRVSFRKNY